VLEDLLAVQVVHGGPQSPKMRWHSPSASTEPVDRPRAWSGRRTTRGCRADAQAPFISGWAQWWPARTQTPRIPEDLGDVVRVRVGRARTRRARRGLGLAAAEARSCPGTSAQAVERVAGRRSSLVLAHGSMPELVEIVDAAPMPTASTIGAVPGLEATGHLGEADLVERRRG
jgi:hypothetical protein